MPDASADRARGSKERSIARLADVAATWDKEHWIGEIRARSANVRPSSRGARIEQCGRVNTKDIAFCVCVEVNINLC